jgi:hypothetical protein
MFRKALKAGEITPFASARSIEEASLRVQGSLSSGQAQVR